MHAAWPRHHHPPASPPSPALYSRIGACDGVEGKVKHPMATKRKLRQYVSIPLGV